MLWQIEIGEKDYQNPIAISLKESIKDLGIKKDIQVEFKKGYLIEGDLDSKEIEQISSQILACPITQNYQIYEFPFFEKEKKREFIFRVFYNPGVTDPETESLKTAIKDLGIKKDLEVRTFKKYILKGDLDSKELEFIKERLLFNPLIEHILTSDKAQKIKSLKEFLNVEYDFRLIKVPIRKAEDKQLLELSKKAQLNLDLEEMRKIKEYFITLNRDPTDCELEMIAQTWSEHCVHKTFKGLIEYTEIITEPKKEIIDNLLQTYIMRVTSTLNKPECVSVFKDNAGIVSIDENLCVCFKVETHNHPSSLEPYGGASTGIGGVIRDILGAGCGAEPVALTDVFCFGLPNTDFKELPKGVLHPKRIMKGVVSGVRDYGNRMGIPTISGAVLFDKRFTANPLVYCGCVGLIPKKFVQKKVDEGDLIVLVGGRTGRDGIHGATFSSDTLDTDSFRISQGAVQIGNPIEEKKLTQAILTARDRGLIKSITDCGGGGLSSAVGETTQHTGCRVYLEKVPLKYKGLSYTEIWISESQERMIIIVSPKDLEELKKIFEAESVELTVIGEVTNTKKVELFYKGEKVCELDTEFLYEKRPKKHLKAIFKKREFPEPQIPEDLDYNQELLKLLSSFNIASKEKIISQYDHEVKALSVLKPLMKIFKSPQDSSVIRISLDSWKGIALSCGINPFYSDIDPYYMAQNAIDEAIRNLVCVGTDPAKIFLLDNFSWASPADPLILGDLVRACKGCYTYALKMQTPFISGKDSLNNEYKSEELRITIPGTLLISGLGILEDVRKVVSSDFKRKDNLIYLLGLTKNELGASEFYRIRGFIGKNVPKPCAELAKKIYEKLFLAIQKDLVCACHDLSEGGLAVALTEMCFGTDFGCTIFLDKVPVDIKKEELKDFVVLFSESASRILVEVNFKAESEFKELFKDLPCKKIGFIDDSKRLKIYGLDKKLIIDLDIKELESAWQKAFKDF